MTRGLRIAALLIAIAAIVDPILALRRPTLLPVDILLPPEDEPGLADALRVRDSLLAALAGSIGTDSGEEPRAIIAIGDVKVSSVPDVPVYAVTLPARARVDPVSAPDVETLWGQQPVVSAAFRARQMTGKATTFTLAEPGGGTLATVQHTWTADDETFMPALAFAPVASGRTSLRVTADSDGAPATAVDVSVFLSERRARVLVFEARPSWAAGFARQAIESDPLFDVRALARTSRGVMARTSAAPASLSSLDHDSADVVLVGGLDALTTTDLGALGAFASDRGGSVVLIPDGRVPDAVRRAFALPSTTEALLERPAELRQGTMTLRAAEILRTSPSGSHAQAVLVVPRGRGQVLLSVGVDAWRYRGDPESAFVPFWRAVAADAARAAPRPASIRLDPWTARPGDEVTLTVALRSMVAVPDGATLPRGTATLVAADGTMEALRLWPGTRANEYVGRFLAPAAGRYDLRVDLDGHPRQDAVFVADPGVRRPARDRSAALTFLTQATGGGIFPPDDMPRLHAAVRAVPAASEMRNVRPTRSPWWMLLFAGCLGSEWAIRRKRGKR